MAKVFVAGALLPTGGAYMAYHLGRLLARHFGYELYDIGIYKVERQIFTYDTRVTTVRIADLPGLVSDEDILIVNPSFSRYFFGLTLPGRKIMYVQDFRTFLLMDCHFDLYVAVSSVVSRYVYAMYGITAAVVPAFIQLAQMPPVVPWEERPPGSALVYMKNPTFEHKTLLDHVAAQLKIRAPHIDLSNILEGRNLTHTEFLKLIGSVRYFVNLSLAEGFGLVPLEAMAMGTLLTGIDGLAGSDYMRPRQNCMVSSTKDLRPLPDMLYEAFSDEQLAASCARAGQHTASFYGYDAFASQWLRIFSEFLQTSPHAA